MKTKSVEKKYYKSVDNFILHAMTLLFFPSSSAVWCSVVKVMITIIIIIIIIVIMIIIADVKRKLKKIRLLEIL